MLSIEENEEEEEEEDDEEENEDDKKMERTKEEEKRSEKQSINKKEEEKKSDKQSIKKEENKKNNSISIEMSNIEKNNNEEMLSDLPINNTNKKNVKKEQKKALIFDKKEFTDKKPQKDKKEIKTKYEPKKVEKIVLLRDVNVKILKGEHIGIIGEVGSGKTCLLNAFINNLKVYSKNENGNIKISGKVSFVSQNPWILNTTVEENILFFNSKDEERYKKKY